MVSPSEPDYDTLQPDGYVYEIQAESVFHAYRLVQEERRKDFERDDE